MSLSRDHWTVQHGHNWALVLAAGEGTRLQSLTTTSSGLAIPKQFCSLASSSSLLEDALSRAHVVAPAERICTVVAEHHEQWWRKLLNGVAAENVIVQPRNRGTANGILLPLLHILHRDADASLLVLPSDHYVRHETVLAASLRQAMEQTRRPSDRIVMLGFAPEEADSELGYIVPAGSHGGMLGDVSEFIEKPSRATADALIKRGGVWNSFIFAANGQALLRAFEEHSPQLVADMRRIVASDGDEATRRRDLMMLYERLPAVDFSRDIVERCPSQLRVLGVPACGWSDLGTPRRVAMAVERNRLKQRTAARAVSNPRSFLDLASQSLLMNWPQENSL
jgi:mannose-1-phosphate guanylyltransferase